MKKRKIKNRIYREAVKKAVNKTIIRVGIFDSIILLVCFILNQNIQDEYSTFVTSVFVGILILFSILYAIIEIDDGIESEKGKISKKIVDDRIPINMYIEVIPKKGHLKYEKFFEKEIPMQLKGKYYLMVQEEVNFIKIFVKLKNYEKYLFLETIKKEDFLESYIVVEKED